jgi:hypothetical protein
MKSSWLRKTTRPRRATCRGFNRGPLHTNGPITYLKRKLIPSIRVEARQLHTCDLRAEVWSELSNAGSIVEKAAWVRVLESPQSRVGVLERLERCVVLVHEDGEQVRVFVLFCCLLVTLLLWLLLSWFIATKSQSGERVRDGLNGSRHDSERGVEYGEGLGMLMVKHDPGGAAYITTIIVIDSSHVAISLECIRRGGCGVDDVLMITRGHGKSYRQGTKVLLPRFCPTSPPRHGSTAFGHRFTSILSKCMNDRVQGDQDIELH